MIRSRILAGAILTVLGMVFAPAGARADFVLTVFDGANIYTFNTLSPGSSTDDIETGTLATPNFSIKVSALSNAPGTNSDGNIANETISIANVGGGIHTVYLALTDTRFTLPGVPKLLLQSTINVTWGFRGNSTDTNDTVSFTSYVNTGDNANDSDSSPLTSQSQVGNAASGSVATSPLSLTSPGFKETDNLNGAKFAYTNPTPGSLYSLSSLMSITLDSGDGIQMTGNSDVTPNPVPVPSNVLLLASCLPLFGLYSMIRRRRAAAMAV